MCRCWIHVTIDLSRHPAGGCGVSAQGASAESNGAKRLSTGRSFAEGRDRIYDDDDDVVADAESIISRESC